MKINTLAVVCLSSSASIATAGGFDAQTLSTSFMYEEGSSASLSYATLNANVAREYTGPVGAGVPGTVKTLKDTTFMSPAFKTNFNGFDIGISNYTSGVILMNTGAAPVPSADAKITTTTILAKYNVGENLAVLGGANMNNLLASGIVSVAGAYDMAASSATSVVAGVAYMIPEIALRAELLYQAKSSFGTTSDFTGAGPLAGVNLSNTETAISRPETLTLNFQTGIAEGTLLFGSVYQAKWAGAPVTIELGNDAFNAADIDESFDTSTKYTVGVGRKLTDSLSVLASYSTEAGSSDPITSLFTMTNGSTAISVGAKYALSDTAALTVGVQQTTYGDVDVDWSGTGPGVDAEYRGSTATTGVISLAYSF